MRSLFTHCTMTCAAAALLALGQGCSPAEPACRVGADCASGVCLRDGTCQQPALAGGADAGGGGATGGGGGGSAGGGSGGGQGGATGGGTGGGSDGGQPSCTPNADGTITRAEVFTQAGLHATFKVSTQTSFDTAGAAQADGGRLWDMTPALSGDQNVLVTTEPITGKWFEANYPGASYVAPLGQGTDLLAVFQSSADGLYLLGVASPTDTVMKTRLTYDPAVKVLAFPMSAGSTWSTTSTVTGYYNGVLIAVLQKDDYTNTVDRTGEVITPFARFPVLRVRTLMNRTANLVPILTLRTFMFVTECFGTVATVTSTDNESSTEFTTAKEVRRLTP